MVATTAEPTVFVVEDDPVMRESLRNLVDSVHLQVETFASAQEFLDALNGGRPGCVVADVRMPGMSGLDLQREIVRRRISLPMIMISGYGDVTSAVQALKAGALDFIEKPFSRQLFLDRIAQAIERDRQVREAETRRAEMAARYARLTRREREVMELVVSGQTNKLIAMELGLCEKTVEVHRAHVMAKMQAGSLAELVRIALFLRAGQT